MTNETPICLSITGNANTKNEIQIRFSKLCENETRKTKFKSVFESDEKTKNKNRNSNPLFKVRRKRKTKNEIQIRFSMSQVDKTRKIEMGMEFHFTRPKKNEK